MANNFPVGNSLIIRKRKKKSIYNNYAKIKSILCPVKKIPSKKQYS